MRVLNVNIILGIGVFYRSFACSFSSLLKEDFPATPDPLAKPGNVEEAVYPMSSGDVSFNNLSSPIEKAETVQSVIPTTEIPLVPSENTNKDPVSVNIESNSNVQRSKEPDLNGTIDDDEEPDAGFLSLVHHYITVPQNSKEKKLPPLPPGEGEAVSATDALNNSTQETFVTSTSSPSTAIPMAIKGSPVTLKFSAARPTAKTITATTKTTKKTTASSSEEDDDEDDETENDEESSDMPTVSADEEDESEDDVDAQNDVEPDFEKATPPKKRVAKGKIIEPLKIKFFNKKNKILQMIVTKGNVSSTVNIRNKYAEKRQEDNEDSEDEESDAKEPEANGEAQNEYVKELEENREDEDVKEPEADEEDEDVKEPEANLEDEGVEMKRQPAKEEDDRHSEEIVNEIEEKKGRHVREDDDRHSEDEDETEKDGGKKVKTNGEVPDDVSPEGVHESLNTTKEFHRDKMSQAAIYTPVLEDVPTSDVEKLKEILQTHFTEPRHWPFNVSNTWHLKMLKAFKSYGLKTFVQENTDLDKFWFYDEHARDTELIKYPIINVIGMLPGKNRGQSKDGILIVGAHYDTRANSPGVDDNGSGMAVLMETARILAKSKYALENTIFFVAFDRKELGFGGSGLFVLEYLIPAELLVKRGYLQGAFIVDTVLNYDKRPRSQSIPKSVKEYSPEATKTIRKNKNRGDFLAVISRTGVEDRLTKTFMDNWNRINDTKYSALEMQIDGTGNVERDEIFYKGYYFFASDHIYFWYHDSHEFNGTLPAVRLFDTGIERGRMRKCHHRACDNASFITEDNLSFLKKTTDTLILSLIDLGQGSTMVPMSSEERQYPWNYFMYMGSAILSGTAFLATTISKLSSD